MEDLKKYFEKSELIPAIVQEKSTGEVLMLAYMNEESLAKTMETGYTWFYSRSRQELWNKGATSGHLQKVYELRADCDNDTLLIKVNPDGPVCHTGTDTCWGEENDNPMAFLSELQRFIEKRHEEMPEGSYTTSLFQSGVGRMAQKVGEEAVESVIEAMAGNDERLIYEASDMIYHLMVLLTSKGLKIEDLAIELQKRHAPNWQKH
jgi:phosphoribosyl-ATP pyrophosphohydrolase/phosphoribosyl-AMP cyclohydrolase